MILDILVLACAYYYSDIFSQLSRIGLTFTSDFIFLFSFLGATK